MAQWRGQFSGLTHGSKLADAEETLRTAVAAFLAAEENAKCVKAKAVRKLAARVLNLRLKSMKASRNRFGPYTREHMEKLKQPELAVLAAGVKGILSEFNVEEVMEY